jgi:hypothetical protein
MLTPNLHPDNSDQGKENSNQPKKEQLPSCSNELVAHLITACGTRYTQFSPTQQELWDKLDIEQRKQLEQNVRINIRDNQIEFLDINMAIYADDLLLEETKTKEDDLLLEEDYKKALAKCTKLGEGRDLPAERSYTNLKESQRFQPEFSAYDKMISYLPGKTELDKAANFSLLTGMDGFYWTKNQVGIQDAKGAYMYRQFSP